MYVSNDLVESEIKKKVIDINVSHFDPFEGLDPQAAALINQRLRDIKHEAELIVKSAIVKAEKLEKKLDIYRKITPD